jgi:hypothetical protein
MRCDTREIIHGEEKERALSKRGGKWPRRKRKQPNK